MDGFRMGEGEMDGIAMEEMRRGGGMIGGIGLGVR
jgi:hypothetical protein